MCLQFIPLISSFLHIVYVMRIKSFLFNKAVLCVRFRVYDVDSPYHNVPVKVNILFAQGLQKSLA